MQRAFVIFVSASTASLALSCDSAESDRPTARACAAEVTLADWRLTADGTRLRDANGRTVLLRGVNAGGRSKLSPHMPFDFEPSDFDARLAVYLDRAKSFGFDALRVPFVWKAVEPTKGKIDEAFLARYDALLDGAWARGMRTIVDFHQDLYAEAFCGDGFPEWTIDPVPQILEHECAQWQLRYYEDDRVKAAFDRLWAEGSPVQEDMAKLWDLIVQRYRDRPGVIGFEIINEPSNGTIPTADFERKTLTDFYSRMIARIHAAAPKSLVFFDPHFQGSAFPHTDMQRPVGDGIVFAPHFYGVTYRDPTFGAGALQPWADVGKAWNVPVLLGEFGFRNDNPDAPALLSGLFDGLDALGMHGTAWEYSTATQIWNEENFNVAAADGSDVPTTTSVIRPFARAVAGDITTTGFDTTARVFTLTFRPAATGVTEVSVPARAFPTGHAIDLVNGCVDTTRDGELRIVADPGAPEVTLRITAK